MGFNFAPLSALSDLGSPASVFLLAHIIVLAASFILSLYGLYGLLKYARGISKNNALIAAFALGSFIPLGDILEHFELFPSADFWHHMHIFGGVFALYFMHRFALTMDSGETDFRRDALFPAIAGIIVVAAFYNEDALGRAFPLIIWGIYAAAVIFLLGSIYFLFDISRRARKAESAFSLKTFAISMVPLISLALFVIAITSMGAEILLDIANVRAVPAAVQTLTVFLIAAQNLLYPLLAMTLLGFGYMSGKIYNLYAPIRKFLESKGQKGQIAPPPAPRGAGKAGGAKPEKRK